VLQLQPLRASDAPAVHGLLGDPEVAVWFRDDSDAAAEPFSLSECEAIVGRWVGHWSAHGFGLSLAWEDDRCVAWSLVQHSILARRSEVEVGWTVMSPHWGRGIGTQMGQDALAQAAALGLDSAVAYARADNPASRRIMEKLGLTFELEFDRHGRPNVLYRKPLTESAP
jgi:RimJ/RimL family protein N-acetyltransferase